VVRYDETIDRMLTLTTETPDCDGCQALTEVLKTLENEDWPSSRCVRGRMLSRGLAIITTTPNWPRWLREEPASELQLKAFLTPFPSEEMTC
jgi:hypothetical protein